MAGIALILAALCLCPANAQVLRVKLAAETAPVSMDIEEYVAGVLAGEAGGFTSVEALRAMAVVARTFARSNRGRHRVDGYDFCETTHCQDVRMRGINALLRRAAQDTEGIILWAGKRPATVFYTEHCGGHTENAGALWSGAARPYLRGVKDDFCLSADRQRWEARISLADLARAMGVKSIQDIGIARRTSTGRVALLHSTSGAFSGEQFHLGVGRTLGWILLRSKLYDLRTEGGDALFEGWGRGHGVGLCQAGAEERGKAGHKWREILAAYFPGTEAGVTADDLLWHSMHSERVEVQGAGGPAEESVPAAAEKALAEAERRSGRIIRMRPLVRVYPSVATFRNATGEPGFVAASTRGRTIRLQPAGRLLAEGRLESILLHEMLHIALARKSGAPLPRWLEEGLALWLEEPLAKPAPLDAATEQRLLRPASEAQLRSAYANARAAVALLVSRMGRETVLSWVDSGISSQELSNMFR